MQKLYSITNPHTGRWTCGLSLENIHEMLRAGAIDDRWLVCQFGDADNAVRIDECAALEMRFRRTSRPTGGQAHQERESGRPVRESAVRHYGRILGLSGKVTHAEVKRKYRELVSQYHPDNVNHLGPKLKDLAEREMKAINEAFEYFKRRYGV